MCEALLQAPGYDMKNKRWTDRTLTLRGLNMLIGEVDRRSLNK